MVEGTHEPIIDRETFHKVRALVDSRKVGGRGGHALRIEPGGDLTAAHALQRHTENAADHGGRVLVDDNPVLLGGVHLVAELPFSLYFHLKICRIFSLTRLDTFR